ncbi:hypothetical protein M422DRAFT_182849, partial [Sphaerobolus stellatus SS14]
TPPNIFGLFRKYLTEPTYDPDGQSPAPVNSPLLSQDPSEGVQMEGTSSHSEYRPFSNFSQFSFSQLWNGNRTGVLSEAFFNDTIKTITDPQFHVDDLKGWSARKMKQQLTSMDDQQSVSPNLPEDVHTSDDWKRNITVTISIPEGKNFWKSPEGFKFEVPGLHYRSIVELIKKVYSTASNIHFTPFELFHKDSDGKIERVYGDLYSSPAYLEEQSKLSSLPKTTYERIIAPLMFWSDSTHLTNFGTASLWPIYAMFGSQSKLQRGKLSARLCHHLAYIPSLPDSIQDVIREFMGGKAASGPLLTHCKRELMHAIWKLLLDDEFCKAYDNGILIQCADGIKRLVYPRIFTYSADYPEKVLLATIRDQGLCLCPRCYITKDKVHDMGMVRDMNNREKNVRKDDLPRRYDILKARSLIYEKGVPVNGAAVESILKPLSRVPTMNAFSEQLQSKGFEYHEIFVVDFLHEIELGVWKATFTHLIRLLYAQDSKNAPHELNQRYRQIPTFGGHTIRRFGDNVSEMKKLAARDFEDILQCSLPAFEGLLEEPFNTLLQDVLFIFCYWHGVAKLRMHTDSTINLLSQLTKQFGSLIRRFEKDTRQHYVTQELPRERAARARREAAVASKNTGKEVVPADPAKIPSKRKTLNLNTYKFHAMGDYPNVIRRVGSIESYSTQRGESEHRIAKQRYSRASKKDTALSLTHMERRDNNMHILSNRKRNCIDIGKFLTENQGDPAVKGFYSCLQDHLLTRILGDNSNDDEINFTHDERMRVLIIGDYMFEHARLRVNFTSYDLRRCQDTLNPKGDNRDFMVYAQDDPNSPSFHPYWYARIIGIYHVNVLYTREDGMMEPPRQMHFLWVRWFGRDSSYNSGPQHRRLDRIGFVHDEDDTEPFGFVDPARVIRSVHLIPAFAHGKTNELLGKSIARRYQEDQEEDWQFFYVNRFVDRDMLMRYMGGGIGHSIQYCTINSTGFEESDDTGDTDSGQLPGPSDTSRTQLRIEEQLAADIEELNEEDYEEVVDEVEIEDNDEVEDGDGDEEAGEEIDDEAEIINEGYESP